MTSNLKPKQEEILRILQEECAEVIQAVSKICRFGIDSDYTGTSNREHLTQELGDLQAMINLAVSNGIVTSQAVHDAATIKITKLMRYTSIYDEEPNE